MRKRSGTIDAAAQPLIKRAWDAVRYTPPSDDVERDESAIGQTLPVLRITPPDEPDLMFRGNYIAGIGIAAWTRNDGLGRAGYYITDGNLQTTEVLLSKQPDGDIFVALGESALRLSSYGRESRKLDACLEVARLLDAMEKIGLLQFDGQPQAADVV